LQRTCEKRHQDKDEDEDDSKQMLTFWAKDEVGSVAIKRATATTVSRGRITCQVTTILMETGK